MYRFPKRIRQEFILKGISPFYLHRYFPEGLKLVLRCLDFETQNSFQNYFLIGRCHLTLGNQWLDHRTGSPQKKGLEFGFSSPFFKKSDLWEEPGWSFIENVFRLHPVSGLELRFRPSLLQKLRINNPTILRLRRHEEEDVVSFTVSCGREVQS